MELEEKDFLPRRFCKDCGKAHICLTAKEKQELQQKQRRGRTAPYTLVKNKFPGVGEDLGFPANNNSEELLNQGMIQFTFLPSKLSRDKRRVK